jgi:RNA polymerase sigma factor (sigma-70 family)
LEGEVLGRDLTGHFAVTAEGEQVVLPGPPGFDRGLRPSEVCTDRELLQACRRGNQQAWEQLVARYERLIYSVALRSGLSREDAADVTQTTFIALLDSMDRLRDDQRLPFWLMTVARRQSWRLRRRRGQELPLGDPGEATADPIDDWERTAVVHEALHRLAAPCRDLLVALYFDPSKPSYAQVAERLGRAVGGLGPMRGRCLERMRALLGEDVGS